MTEKGHHIITDVQMLYGAKKCDAKQSQNVFLVHGQVTIILVVSVGFSVCLSVCLFVQFFSAVFDPISIKLGHMLNVWV